MLTGGGHSKGQAVFFNLAHFQGENSRETPTWLEIKTALLTSLSIDMDQAEHYASHITLFVHVEWDILGYKWTFYPQIVCVRT